MFNHGLIHHGKVLGIVEKMVVKVGEERDAMWRRGDSVKILGCKDLVKKAWDRIWGSRITRWI